MLVATVEPSELQGPPGSSLLWSVTHAKVLNRDMSKSKGWTL